VVAGSIRAINRHRDDKHDLVEASAEGIRTVLALLEQGTVLLWDGDAQTLIVVNIAWWSHPKTRLVKAVKKNANSVSGSLG
jgi:hypothetical protein